jgi:hypothetical protein
MRWLASGNAWSRYMFSPVFGPAIVSAWARATIFTVMALRIRRGRATDERRQII